MNEDIKPIGVKAPLHLLPFKPLCAIAAAMQHGAVKYAPWNWQDNSHMTDRTEELYGALLRHTLAASDPSQDDYDDESGLHHLCHAGACVLILLFKLGIRYKPSNWLPYIDGDQLRAETSADPPAQSIYNSRPTSLEDFEPEMMNDPYVRWCRANDHDVSITSCILYYDYLDSLAVDNSPPAIIKRDRAEAERRNREKGIQ